MKLAIALGFAIGCGGSAPPVQKPAPEPAPNPAASCATVATHLTATLPRWGASADEATKIAAVYDVRCNEDRWSAEARACFSTMTVDTDMIKCDKALAPDQQASLTKALEPLEQDSPAQQDAMLARFDEFATQACNCKAGDSACAQKVSEDMTKWAESQPGNGPSIKPDDARVAEIAKKLSDCITKAMMPIEPPPAPPPKSGTPKKKPAGK